MWITIGASSRPFVTSWGGPDREGGGGVISVNDLTQTYRSGKGVFDLSFTVNEGEVFGYLGPNGAGKTTTIRNLLGFANADSGSATIDGLDCRRDSVEIQKIVGYVPGETAFFDNMSGREFLRFVADMRRIKDRARRDELVDRFELDVTPRIRKMSKGMKQKLALVAGFMHDPQVYILDEPTSGLDPMMQTVFMDLLRAEKERGKTILMSSHIFDEVQRICDRAGIIRDGRIVAIEEIHALNEMKQEAYIVGVEDPADLDRLSSIGITVERISSRRARIIVHGNYRELFTALSGCKVVGFESEPQSLETIFLSYFMGEAR